jgi:hypothetical protein
VPIVTGSKFEILLTRLAQRPDKARMPGAKRRAYRLLLLGSL